jgi:hypothetical protein
MRSLELAVSLFLVWAFSSRARRSPNACSAAPLCSTPEMTIALAYLSSRCRREMSYSMNS